ncbi:MAG: NUDIX domain-containing protein [Hyphomicrobiaceae bacterium]|nr:NUDIX domain-containing protein [Hyphomicrobiaceae bacterium]
MKSERIVRRLMQHYWRWQRALTLGARGIVVDGDGRVLLVRHTYSPGWIFPGGGVEFGESVDTALRRELAEEANVEITAPPTLLGIYSNWEIYPGDHVAIFVVRQWRQSHMPAPNREIAAVGFFEADALPEGTTPGTRRRVVEMLTGSPPHDLW